jgi:MazG family protein
VLHYDQPSPPESFDGPPPSIDVDDPFRRLVAIMARRRGPGGCPWDREQTHDSLRQYLIEEAYEVLDAIEERADDKLAEELGDVLLQVVFHAQLAAEEQGRFAIDDVCRAICEKLIRRHPHVFGDVDASDANAVLRNWEKIKAEERAAEKARGEKNGREEPADDPHGVGRLFSGTPRHLPALQKAARIQEKAARVGFDWPTLAPVLDKVSEELGEWMDELRAAGIDEVVNPHLDAIARERLMGAAEGEAGGTDAPGVEPPSVEGADDAAVAADRAAHLPPGVAEEFGDLLFAMVNAARFLGLEPEQCLQDANTKFVNRFVAMERAIRADGGRLEGMPLEEMDRYWEQVKREAKAAAAACVDNGNS